MKKYSILIPSFLWLGGCTMVPAPSNIHSAQSSYSAQSSLHISDEAFAHKSSEEFCAQYGMKPTQRTITCMALTPECMCDPA